VCKCGERSGLRDVKRADFIWYWRRSGLKNPDKPKIFTKKNVRNHSHHRFWRTSGLIEVYCIYSLSEIQHVTQEIKKSRHQKGLCTRQNVTQEIKKSRHQKGLFRPFIYFVRVFRPVKSTMRMLLKQNSLKR